MKYFSFFKMCFNQGLQYRFSAIAGLMTQFFWGMMMIFLYEAFYNNGIATPMEWPKLMSYIWLGQTFYTLIFFRAMNKDIFDSLKTRSNRLRICKAFKYILDVVCKNMWRKTFSMLIKGFACIIICNNYSSSV